MPWESNRIELPTLPSGNSANFSEAAPPGVSLPMVPGLPMLTTNRFPSASTAGHSMPKVYSPEGVTCRLSNSFGSACAQVEIAPSNSALQRHQNLSPKAVRVAALADCDALECFG